MKPTPLVTFSFDLLTLSYISCQMPTELSILHCKKTLRTIWCTSTQCIFIWIEIFIDLLFWFLYAVCWIEIWGRWYFTFQNWIQIFYIIRSISQCFNFWKLRICRDIWNTITKRIICCKTLCLKIQKVDLTVVNRSSSFFFWLSSLPTRTSRFWNFIIWSGTKSIRLYCY